MKTTKMKWAGIIPDTALTSGTVATILEGERKLEGIVESVDIDKGVINFNHNNTIITLDFSNIKGIINIDNSKNSKTRKVEHFFT